MKPSKYRAIVEAIFMLITWVTQAVQARPTNISMQIILIWIHSCGQPIKEVAP
jgi:hypothetical protein